MNDRIKKSGVRFDATMDFRKVIDHIDKLSAAMKAGTLHLQRGGDDVTLKPGKGPAYIGVEAKQGSDKESLTIKLKWRPATAMAAKEQEPLKISAKAPPAPKPEPAPAPAPKPAAKKKAPSKPAAKKTKVKKPVAKKKPRKSAAKKKKK